MSRKHQKSFFTSSEHFRSSLLWFLGGVVAGFIIFTIVWCLVRRSQRQTSKKKFEVKAINQQDYSANFDKSEAMDLEYKSEAN